MPRPGPLATEDASFFGLRLRCQQVTRALSKRQDQRLVPAEAARLRLHLLMCKNCRNAGAQVAFLRTAMRRLAGQDAAAGTTTTELTPTAND